MADQNPQDPFEVFRRLWGPLGVPLPGMAMPTLDPAEVEKRISDLRSVETWLAMNLNMVKMAIQGLEAQKMTLAAMQANSLAAGDAASAFANLSLNAAGGGAGTAGNPMLWPWAMMQGTAPAAEKPAEPKPPAAGTERKEGK